jgi:mevalonate pyrophosphate decarboxylase
VELSDHLSKLVEQQLQEFQKTINSEAPVSDKPNPFHTIDYFASQGIKLLQGGQQQDQLANKVKSFTEWLKQMKRINQQPTDLGTDADTERIIENIAQTSNETKEVITETMAQVLAKQGKTAKAIQLYQKLSFLDPSKNIYFAAKIQELKDK